ncbi:Chaperone protein HtpG, partial [Dissostichus eleginoides]
RGPERLDLIWRVPQPLFPTICMLHCQEGDLWLFACDQVFVWVHTWVLDKLPELGKDRCSLHQQAPGPRLLLSENERRHGVCVLGREDRLKDGGNKGVAEEAMR